MCSLPWKTLLFGCGLRPDGKFQWNIALELQIFVRKSTISFFTSKANFIKKLYPHVLKHFWSEGDSLSELDFRAIKLLKRSNFPLKIDLMIKLFPKWERLEEECPFKVLGIHDTIVLYIQYARTCSLLLIAR